MIKGNYVPIQNVLST